MFFYLSKIFWFFIQPLNLAIFLLAALARRVASGGVWPRPLGASLAFLILALSAWTSLGAHDAQSAGGALPAAAAAGQGRRHHRARRRFRGRHQSGARRL